SHAASASSAAVVPSSVPARPSAPRDAANARAAAATIAPDQAEHLLVDRARAGVRRGMHDEALVSLMEHARRFPSGDRAEERDVLTIEAYVGAGNVPLARRAIERYRVTHAAGVLR